MYRKLFAILLAGALLPLAFAPFNLFPVACLAPTILIYYWYDAKPSASFYYGFLFGLGCFGIGVSWVFISMHRFGNLPVPLASLFTALFVCVLALFPAIQGYLLNRFFPQATPIKLLIAIPSSFALVDWIRSWILTGFPWLLLGYSQTNSPLKGYAPIVGEYGLSFILTLTSALLVLSRRFSNDHSSKRILTYGIISIIWLTGFGLSKIQWTHPTNRTIRVSLVQGNIPQQLKWEADFIQPTLEHYTSLTQQHWDSDLIIWPEAAVPITYQDASEFLASLTKQAKQHHAHVLLGIPEAVGNEHYYNALYTIGADHGRYYKRHLVPFGEYIPFEKQLTWLFHFWQIPMSSLLPGNITQAALRINGFTIAPFICYEIAYAHLVEMIPPATDFLVTVSNDAWFGESFAPAQHLQIAQFRAIATQRPALVSTNNGITALIDKDGSLVKTLPQFESGVLVGQVMARNSSTPIMVYKSTSIIIIFWLLIGLAYVLRSRNLVSLKAT